MAGGPNYVISSVASGVAAGTYGSSSDIPQLTVDTYGRITAASTNPNPSLSSSTLVVAGHTVNLPIITPPSTEGSATSIPSVTTDEFGRITALSGNTIPILSSGAYTPVWTWVSGGSVAVTDNDAQYLRIGSYCIVSFKCSVVTLTSTTATARLSVPIATTLASLNDAIGGGTMANVTSSTTYCGINSAGGDTTVKINLVSTSATASGSLRGGFTYAIR